MPDYEEEYHDSLTQHIVNVKEAYLKITGHILLSHDKSKFSIEEFKPAAERFFGPNENQDTYNYAWLHYIHNNPHHWQHWVVPNTDIVVEMPLQCVQEMVADWMGASKSYTGSWDMTEWLVEHLPLINLHPNTRNLVMYILTSKPLNYSLEVLEREANYIRHSKEILCVVQQYKCI